MKMLIDLFIINGTIKSYIHIKNTDHWPEPLCVSTYLKKKTCTGLTKTVNADQIFVQQYFWHFTNIESMMIDLKG